MRRLALSALIMCLALSTVASATMLREIWDNQSTGNLAEALAVVNSGAAPDRTDVLDIAGWPGDDGSDYVARATGWIVVPATGDYTFWVAADDHCGLWVSSDANPPSLEEDPIAFVDGWTSYQEWGKYDSQKAEPMSLTEGQVLAVTGVMREGGGGDNFAIGWTGPGVDEITLVSEHITHLAYKAGISAPANGADLVINAELSWVAPGLVEDPVYDLYFGTDPEALELIAEGIVESAVDVGSAGEELDFATTYYWRVDASGEVGDVWSFTTEPFSFPIAGVTATTNGVSGPDVGGIEQTIDGSGLDENDGHSTESMDMWLAVPPEGEALMVEYTFDRVYKMDTMMIWNSNTGFEPFLGYGVKDVTIEYTVDGAEWMVLADVEVARAPGVEGNPADTTVDFGGVAASAVRLTVNTNWGGLFPDSGLSEVRFMYIPGQARFPMPAVGAEGVAPDAMLSWQAGRDSVSTDVLIGVDDLALAGTVEGDSFAPELVYGMPYMWRVDENDGVDVWEGDAWSFTTREFGTVVAEQTLEFDNTAEPFLSEVETVLDPPVDLTAFAADTLKLSFKGNPVGYEDVDGVVTVGASGNDIWGSSDQFRYAYKSLTGDGEMIVRVDNIENVTNTWAKAGAMIRQSTDPNSANVMICITGGSGDGASFQWRETAGAGSGSSRTLAGIAPPYYARLVREGNSFTGYVSADGVEWQQEGESAIDVNMVDPVLIGLAVTSHDSGSSVIVTASEISTIGDVTGDVVVEAIGVEMPANDATGLYVKLEDSTGAVAVVQNADPGATQGAATQAWIVPLNTIEGIDLTSVAKIIVGAGDAANPVADGTGSVDIGAIQVGTPLSHNVPADVTGPGDVVQGVPNDEDWPGAETPDLAIDNNAETKYLHFKGDFDPDAGPTGFQVAPASGATIVTELTFTTANDVPGRDPIAFELYGSNDGIDGPYTLIAAGDIVDFAGEAEWPRFTKNTTPIVFENDVAYSNYQVLFPAIRGPVGGSVNSMQIAEVEIIGVVAP